MSASEHAKEVAALLKRLRSLYGDQPDAAASGPVLDQAEPILGEFIRSFMVWEATTPKAAAVLKRLEQTVVDFNELRICLPDELISMMGERYPRVEERALRLRAALNEIYHRQHAVTLEHLIAMGKREARDYLDSLDGVPRFVASRVFLTCLGGHAAPVDGRIYRRLVEAGVSDNAAGPDAAAAALERTIRAGELTDTYRLLQAWADEAPLNYSETPTELPKRKDPKPPAAPPPSPTSSSAAASSNAGASKKRPQRTPRTSTSPTPRSRKKPAN